MRAEWPPGRPEDGEGGATASPADVEEVVTKHLITNAISVDDSPQDTASQLHRRNQAALRMPPLHNGRRDPISARLGRWHR